MPKLLLPHRAKVQYFPEAKIMYNEKHFHYGVLFRGILLTVYGYLFTENIQQIW